VSDSQLDPVALLASLVLEDGATWGSRAEGWQWSDAGAFFDRSGDAPRRHFNLRGRGMSKSTDAGGYGLVSLLTEAPVRSRSHLYAVDGDQAAIVTDAIGGLVQRSGLGALIEVTGRAVTNRQTGASLAVESSDGASAYGLRPWLSIVDEMGMWPSTDNHRALWAAILSGVPKVPGSRLLCIGTAGSPAGLGAGAWQAALASPAWRTSLNPGPAPWWTPEDVDATRASLTASEWRRLILCEWAQGDDALTTAEDVEACIRPGSSTLAPNLAHTYVASLDVGTRRDLSAFAIGHSEQRAAGRVVVIDAVRYWRPGKGVEGRVDLSAVEATVLRLCREYSVARLRNDRMQSEQMTGNLAREGVHVQEYVFSAAGAARLARSLHVALRDRAVSLPDDEEVRSEAQTVRMVETGPSTVKLSNPPGTHDDVLTAIGMVVADLVEQPELGPGSVSSPARISMAAYRAGAAQAPAGPQLGNPAYRLRATRGVLADLAKAQREQTAAMRRAGLGLVVPGSANDPARVRRRSRRSRRDVAAVRQPVAHERGCDAAGGDDNAPPLGIGGGALGRA